MAETLRAAPVVVIGGGLSGLTAALTLATRGIPVRLFEQRPHLGGRTFSFRDATTGDTVDNGQHVLITGYTRTLALLDNLGSRHLVTIPRRPAMVMHLPDAGFRTLRFPRLPSPLHFVAGIAATDLCTLNEKQALLRAGLSLRFLSRHDRSVAAGLTVGEWLHRHGQPEGLIGKFWEPLTVSMMNAGTSTAPALLFLEALRIAFLGGWNHAAIVIPSVGLSELFVLPAQEKLRSLHADLHIDVGIDRILADGSGVTGVVDDEGVTHPARAVICAVPPHALAKILPEQPSLASFRTLGSQLGVSSIVSMHLWFTEAFMQHDMVGLVGRTVQWLFRRAHHVSATISAAGTESGMTTDDLVARAVEDIRSVYGSHISGPYHSLVIREKRATYAATPRTESLRPAHETPVPGLILAGDWIRTGLPATIEGAIRSGEQAAELVVRRRA